MKFSYPTGFGGTFEAELPDPENHPTLSCWVQRSPIPDTLPWAWAVTNIEIKSFPGLTNGYAATREQAATAVAHALRFWAARGYQVIPVEC